MPYPGGLCLYLPRELYATPPFPGPAYADTRQQAPLEDQKSDLSMMQAQNAQPPQPQMAMRQQS